MELQFSEQQLFILRIFYKPNGDQAQILGGGWNCLKFSGLRWKEGSKTPGIFPKSLFFKGDGTPTPTWISLNSSFFRFYLKKWITRKKNQKRLGP